MTTTFKRQRDVYSSEKGDYYKTEDTETIVRRSGYKNIYLNESKKDESWVTIIIYNYKYMK